MKLHPEYRQIRNEVEAQGFFTVVRLQRDVPFGLSIASKRDPDGRLHGISCWVTLTEGKWFVASWLYNYWRVPNPQDVASVCIRWLKDGTTLSEPPADVIEEYDLEEYSMERFSAVFIDVDIPDALISLFEAQKEYHQRTHGYSYSLEEVEKYANGSPWYDLPKGYEIDIRKEASGWRAIAESLEDDRVFEIDSAGKLSVGRRDHGA